MGSPVNVSEILANLPGGNSDDEPDWLKELEEGDDGKEASDGQGSQSSEDPFAFLTTPGKSPFKGSQPPTPGESSKPPAQEASTPEPVVKKPKSAASLANGRAPGRVTIKNPDKVTFNRLLVELPYKESDCVDLSGDTGAVGRFTFCNRVKARPPEDPPSGAQPDHTEAPAPSGGEAGPSSAQLAASGKEGSAEPDEVEEALVLDLKGVMFDAQIAALAGTACIVNIGPSGAKVEAVFNEFVHLDETSVFEDYEEITDGTVQGWTLADPEDAITGDGAKPGAKKPKKGPLISSGRVAKATKRKGASKAGQSRTAQKATKKKR